MRTIALRAGYDLLFFDCKPRKIMLEINEAAPPTIGFNFLVSGEVKSRIADHKESSLFGGGQSNILYSPEQWGSMEGLGKENIRIVSVQLPLRLFRNLMENELDGMQGDFKRLVEGNDNQLYCRTVPIMPACRMALQQMLGCPYHGPVKQFFLESRALELIAYQLKELTTPKGAGRQSGALRGGDIERVHAVAEILKKNLDNPPGIRELTRATGLTHIKLQRGFREIYDTTPFGYLRLIRMNKAKALMEEQDLNVTETALSVGYASLSHFAKAFKEHFGISPSQYRKQRCL